MAVSRVRRDAAEFDHVYKAAFLGDPCPPGFNHWRFYFLVEAVLYGERNQFFQEAREAWPRLRPAVLLEWKRRRGKGSPPGAKFDTEKRS